MSRVREIFVAGCLLATASVWHAAGASVRNSAPVTLPAADVRDGSQALMKRRVAILRQTAASFRRIATSLPEEAPVVEAESAQEYAKWLDAKATQMDELAEQGEGSVGIGGAASGSAIGAAAGGSSQDPLLNATKNMQETQMSFNLQYLQLQSQMQHENRSYTAISNIMKTKHDTVKNSISNIR